MTKEHGNQTQHETLVEEFGEHQAAHTEWWAEESGRVEEVVEAILGAVRERDDVQLVKRGTSVSKTGVHEASFELRVAGEPWEFDGSGEERTIHCCGACERLFGDPDTTALANRCPHCGEPVSSEDTEVRSVVF